MARARRKLRILVVHGPNLNLLGVRQPTVYGTTTLAEIDRELAKRAAAHGATVWSYQSNVEGELVTRIQQARTTADAILINAAAYTHTSVAIRDALDAVALPAIEVHLSHLARREDFRQISLVGPACIGQVSGFGASSYYLALEAAIAHLEKEDQR